MNRLSYRPDIDGLRAVAVLGVLFFHAGLGCQGGFVGVDVFFVISGFLITSLILRDLREGTFSFADFWARRIRRIVPALAVMTLAVIVVGYFGMFPDYYETLGKQMIALVLCVSNVKFWRETGYFDTASDEKPLLHTWSLSVEEQFYFIIPIALFLVFKFRRETFALPLIILTCLGSFAVSVYASYNHPSANFYLLPTRAWELGAGSLLSFARPINSPKLREVSSFIGLGLIIGCYFLFPEDASFPGVSALPPVIGAALIIWSGIGQTKLPAIGRLLTLKPIVGIGLISYSLYLWHWPIFAYQKHLGYSSESQPTQFILLVISFVPAWLSWRFVETPFRLKQVIKGQHSIIVFGLSWALTGFIFGMTSWLTKGINHRFDHSFDGYLSKCKESKGHFFRKVRAVDELGFKIPKFWANGSTRSYSTHYIGLNDQIEFIFCGDSHAGSLSYAVDLKAQELGMSGAVVQASSGIPLLNYGNPRAQKLMRHIISIKPKTVYLCGYWNNINYASAAKKKLSSQTLEQAFRSTIQTLTDEGIFVVIIQDVPIFTENPVTFWLEKRYNQILPLRKKNSLTDLVITEQEYLKTTGYPNHLIEEITDEFENATSVSVKEIFFPKHLEFKPYDNNATFYFDDNHINDYGAVFLLSDSIEEWLSIAQRQTTD